MNDFLLADDLSGALDAAGAFHHAGQKVKIVLSAEAWPDGSGRELVAFTTETRNAPPQVAATAVRRALAQGRERGGRLVYKKIDSTLRGPVAAELAALAAELPQMRILFAPANPPMGRTVQRGVLCVHGVPVAETEFGRDPMNPVRESVIVRLLGGVAPGRIHIPDALTAAELDQAVAEIAAAGSPWIAVGSGALARSVAALAVGLGPDPTGEMTRDAAPSGADGREDPRGASRGERIPGRPSSPALVVCGSAHPQNRLQAMMLADARGVRIHVLRPDAPRLAAAAVLRDLRAGYGAALVVPEPRGDSVKIVGALIASVGGIMAGAAPTRLFVTGGETAFALCRSVGISALTFCRELEPGLSLARAEEAHAGLVLAVKPGGFGDTHTWVRAWDALVAS